MSPIEQNMDWIRQLCALSVFCGAALSLAPEGGVKKAAVLCCTVLLMLSVVNGVKNMDMSAYALELQRYKELSESFSEQARESGERLNRLVIEQECEEYILNRAASLGLIGLEAEVTARWHTDGFWVPDSVELRGSPTEKEKRQMEEWIAIDLGIGPEKQEWIEIGR